MMDFCPDGGLWDNEEGILISVSRSTDDFVLHFLMCLSPRRDDWKNTGHLGVQRLRCHYDYVGSVQERSTWCEPSGFCMLSCNATAICCGVACLSESNGHHAQGPGFDIPGIWVSFATLWGLWLRSPRVWNGEGTPFSSGVLACEVPSI